MAKTDILLCSLLSFTVLRKVLIPFILQHFEFRKTMKKEERNDFDSKIISTIHAIGISFISIAMLLLDGKFGREFDVAHTSEKVPKMLMFSLGYFIFDTLYLVSDWKKNQLFLVHHSVVILMEIVVLLTNCLHVGVLLGALMEVPVLFINNLTFLKMLGYRSSTIFQLNGVMLAASWTMFRMVFGVIGFQVLLVMRYPQIIKNFGFGIYLAWQFVYVIIAYMNTTWWLKIVKGMMKILTPKN